MSNYLAIATVTACLKQLLQPAADIIGGATVTTTRPDLMTNSGTTTPGVNIFMYQVMPNAAWRNEDLPARRADGTVITRPRVAIDLYYMISFHGNESELEPQRLLGSVVRTMHEKPVLNRDLISATVDATSYLSSPLRSNLDDEIELVKFTPTALSTEEISKLWAAFQTPYVLTAVYHGTVVLIDGLSDPFEALPVQSRNIYVYPYGQPVIDKVVSQDGNNIPIETTSTLLIQGRSLGGDPSLVTKVRIGDEEIVATQVTSSTITFPLASVTTLYPGILPVQVIQPRMIGTPPVEHVGSESNTLPVVVHPRINAVSLGIFTGTSPNLSGPLTVSTSSTIGLTQRVVLLLNEMATPSPAYYSFVVPDRVADSDSFDIDLTGLKAGTYLVRIMVDGAQSIWDDDTPTFAVP